MTLYNWFEARNLARAQGYAIRFTTVQAWFVYRAAKWWTYTLDVTSGRWFAHEVRASEFGVTDFQRKDFTIEPWDGGALPPCSNPGTPDGPAPNVTGGLASWGTDATCVPPAEEVATGEVATPAEPPPPNELTIVLRAFDGPDRPEGSTYDFHGTCWSDFPRGQFAGYRVYRKLPPRTLKFGQINFGYLARNKPRNTWVQSGSAAPAGAPPGMRVPTYTDVLGPLDVYGLSELASPDYDAPGFESETVPWYMGPATIQQSPGDGFTAEMVIGYGTSDGGVYRATRVIPGWCAPTEITFEPDWSPATGPDGERHYCQDLGEDGILGTYGDPDNDDTYTHAVCYNASPGTMDVTFSVTAVGGKPGPGTLVIRETDSDGAVLATISGRTGSYTFSGVTYSAYSGPQVYVVFSQPENEYGAAVDGHAGYPFEAAPICGTLPDSTETPP